jgi:tRNA(Arg) A34 adenosine deaminase TadA
VAVFFAQPHNGRMCLRQGPTGIRRRSCLLVALPWLVAPPAWPASPLQQAMRQAEALRDDAMRAGDQPYGAVVVRADVVVGAAASRVVTSMDPTAHAEMEAIRDAARKLRTRDLSGCVLVSTSRPCRMCEAAAGWAGISRMVYGESLTDGGAPR